MISIRSFIFGGLCLFLALPTLYLLMAQPTQAQNENFKLEDGDTIVFLGDSITQAASKAEGYISLLDLFLGVNGYVVETVNAGISGHKSNDMLARLQDDVLDHEPDWVSISCGVNDVWHQFAFDPEGVPLDEYKENIREIINRCRDAGAQVLLNTATPIHEDLDNKENKMLASYNAFLRELAEEENIILADQYKEFADLISKKLDDTLLLTTDGVHPNPRGHRLMARTIFRALGANRGEERRAEKRWELVNNMQPMGKDSK